MGEKQRPKLYRQFDKFLIVNGCRLQSDFGLSETKGVPYVIEIPREKQKK